MLSRHNGVYMNDDVLLKRGSAYRSSREVKRTMKLNLGGGIGSTSTDDFFLPSEIVDTSSRVRRGDAFLICEQTQSPIASLNDFAHVMPAKSTDILDFPCDLPQERLNLNQPCSCCASKNNSYMGSPLDAWLHSDTDSPCYKAASNSFNIECTEEQISKSNKMLGPGSERHTLYNRDMLRSLSRSSKVEQPISPSQPETESLKANTKVRFSPLKKIFDPTMKLKSTGKNSLIEAKEASSTSNGSAVSSRSGTFRKSLLKDFSNAANKVDYDRPLITRDLVSSTASSPAHLYAVLECESRHGVLSFKFSVKDREEVLSAKTWSTGSALSWAYTFHRGKRKGYSSSQGMIDRHVPSLPVVGQMQVKCFMRSDVGENGSRENYMETEFILYDIAQAGRVVSVERSHCRSYSAVSESLFTNSSLVTKKSTDKCKNHARHTSTDRQFDPSTSYPWSTVELHPHLEIAAISIRVPLKKENLKGRQSEETGSKDHSNIANIPSKLYGSVSESNLKSPIFLKVIAPTGKHNLPSNGGVPSALLDRWRYGGGCDCGGWDMTCPVTVLDNFCASHFHCSVMGNQESLQLFFQGRKEKLPAISITADGKGHYAVDFHGQLSALQAFSICIAMLHSSEAPPFCQEMTNPGLHSNSLRLLLEKEVKHLIETVADGKIKANKKAEQIQPSFIINHPPFSPIGRV